MHILLVKTQICLVIYICELPALEISPSGFLKFYLKCVTQGTSPYLAGHPRS